MESNKSNFLGKKKKSEFRSKQYPNYMTRNKTVGKFD